MVNMAERKVRTLEETMHLITLYESHPEVWDSRHINYKNQEMGSMCWKSMGEVLHTSPNEVQRKIHNFRNQVSQELDKMNKRKSGRGAEEVYTSTWPYFNALKFITPSLLPRQSTSNLTLPA